MYAVKEIYYTIQGEGFHAGRPAVFLRFSGCNLWSGLEKDRASAICSFCDTDFWGTDGTLGGKYSAEELADLCKSLWPEIHPNEAFVVCTGGEPLLQLDQPLIDALKLRGFYIAIESNGTLAVPNGIDWVCISPKVGAHLIVQKGNELKLVHPQALVDPNSFLNLEFDHFYLQPLDDENRFDNTNLCVDLCKTYPRWKLSLQSHKLINIP